MLGDSVRVWSRKVSTVRKSIVSVATVAVGLLGITGSALAAPPPWVHGGRHYTEDGYDYARVVDVDPIMTQVRSAVPRRDCYNEVQRSSGYSYSRGYSSQSAAPTLIGGIIGGVIGSQIGHGHGRSVATVAGTLLGAGIGQAAGRNANDRAYEYEEPQERVVQRCSMTYDDQVEQRIDGYRVTYVYQGREYSTRMPYDPGDRVRIRVDVIPAGY
jgi:uncharacterized protein YcfJ